MKTYTVYRGVRDTALSDIDKYFKGQGVFGEGTYYALDEDNATGYALDEIYGLVLKGELTLKNPLELNSKEFPEISDVNTGATWVDDLSELCEKEGYDGVVLTGQVDGGEQILIPTNSKPRLNIEGFKIVTPDQRILDDLGLDYKRCEIDSSHFVSDFLPWDFDADEILWEHSDRYHGYHSEAEIEPDITKEIKRLIADIGKSPYEINNGKCDIIADEIERTIPEAVGVSTESFTDSGKYPGHIWILYNGKHYDAEAPEGVDDWQDLPIFKKATTAEIEPESLEKCIEYWVEDNERGLLEEYFIHHGEEPINESPDGPLYKGMVLDQEQINQLKTTGKLPANNYLLESWTIYKNVAENIGTGHVYAGEYAVIQKRDVPKNERYLNLHDSEYSEGEGEIVCQSQPVILEECEIKFAQPLENEKDPSRYNLVEANIDKLYHISPKDFDSFKQQIKNSWEASDLGFHFGTEETIKNVVDLLEHRGNWEQGDDLFKYTVSLDIKNPLRLEEDRLGSWSANNIVQKVMEKAENDSVDGITEEAIDSFYEDEIFFKDGTEWWGDIYAENDRESNVVRWLNELGYDGIVYENTYEGGGDSYIAFKPSQVKILSKENVSKEDLKAVSYLAIAKTVVPDVYLQPEALKMIEDEIGNMAWEIEQSEAGKRGGVTIVNPEDNDGYLKFINTTKKSTFPHYLQEIFKGNGTKKKFLEAVNRGKGEVYNRIMIHAIERLEQGYMNQHGYDMPNEEFLEIIRNSEELDKVS